MNRAILALTAALATTAVASTASASPAALVGSIAAKIADKAFGFAVGEAINAVLGANPQQGPVNLSSAAFDNIDRIVVDAVQNGRFADYQTKFETLVTTARVPAPNETVLYENIVRANEVSNGMSQFGYRGVPGFMLAKSIELHTLELLARWFDAANPGDAQITREERSLGAEAARARLVALEQQWQSEAANRYRSEWREVSRAIEGYQRFSYTYRVCFDAPEGQVCSPTAMKQTHWVDQGGYQQMMTEYSPWGGNPAAEIAATVSARKASEYEAVFGTELPLLLDNLEAIAGDFYCPTGDYDGSRCVIATPPAGTHGFALDGHLYTTPQWQPTCPAGTLDGDKCLIETTPAGGRPFIYGGMLHYVPAQPGVCPVGSFDGINCFVAAPSNGTQAVIVGDKLMTTSVQAPTCPIGWYDGANCYVASPSPGTTAFIGGDGKLCTTPVDPTAI